MEETDRLTAEGILFTDEYQLTIAQFYYRMGLHDMHAQFDHFFRSYPNYGAHQAGGKCWMKIHSQPTVEEDEAIILR